MVACWVCRDLKRKCTIGRFGREEEAELAYRRAAERLLEEGERAHV
jgi:hypothetical protein